MGLWSVPVSQGDAHAICVPAVACGPVHDSCLRGPVSTESQGVPRVWEFRGMQREYQVSRLQL